MIAGLWAMGRGPWAMAHGLWHFIVCLTKKIVLRESLPADPLRLHREIRNAHKRAQAQHYSERAEEGGLSVRCPRLDGTRRWSAVRRVGKFLTGHAA